MYDHCIATVLVLIGAFLFIICSLLLVGYISKGEGDHKGPGLFISILVFLPGFTTCISPTLHLKATNITPTMIFQNLMISTHLSPEEQSQTGLSLALRY